MKCNAASVDEIKMVSRVCRQAERGMSDPMYKAAMCSLEMRAGGAVKGQSATVVMSVGEGQERATLLP